MVSKATIVITFYYRHVFGIQGHGITHLLISNIVLQFEIKSTKKPAWFIRTKVGDVYTMPSILTSEAALSLVYL
jgi:hypothetical protein